MLPPISEYIEICPSKFDDATNAGFLGHQARSKLHSLVFANSARISPFCWFEFGFQQRILLSFAHDNSKSGSSVHHAKERTPLW